MLWRHNIDHLSIMCTMQNLYIQVAQKLSIPSWKVEASILLFQDGCTLPFVARYRKEKTGSLNEAQLEQIQEQHTRIHECEERRKKILETLQQQGVLNQKIVSLN